MKKVYFYFCFRSRYSWLAINRFSELIDTYSLDYSLMPVFPSSVVNAIAPGNSKLRYMVDDARRIATAYGLQFNFPEKFDIEWLHPHAAFLYANEQGKGLEFCLQAHNQRFCHGWDLSDESVIRDIAIQCQISPDDTLNAFNDPVYHDKVLAIIQDAGNSGVFGVPSFIYNKKLFWGNDRLEWLIREIQNDKGQAVPDLCRDHFLRPF